MRTKILSYVTSGCYGIQAFHARLDYMYGLHMTLCEIFDNYDGIRTVTVILNFTGSVMLVETPSTGVEVDAGSTVYYVCVGYDDELDPPNITWKFGNTLLKNDSSVNIYTKLVELNNLTFTQSILELCGVQVQDNGGYSCSAIGSTNSTHSFDLKVKARTIIIDVVTW